MEKTVCVSREFTVIIPTLSNYIEHGPSVYIAYDDHAKEEFARIWPVSAADTGKLLGWRFLDNVYTSEESVVEAIKAEVTKRIRVIGTK